MRPDCGDVDGNEVADDDERNVQRDRYDRRRDQRRVPFIDGAAEDHRDENHHECRDDHRELLDHRDRAGDAEDGNNQYQGDKQKDAEDGLGPAASMIHLPYRV